MRVNGVNLFNNYRKNFLGTIRFKDSNGNLVGEQVVENGKTKSTTSYFYDDENKLMLVVNKSFEEPDVVTTTVDYSNLYDVDVKKS